MSLADRTLLSKLRNAINTFFSTRRECLKRELQEIKSLPARKKAMRLGIFAGFTVIALILASTLLSRIVICLDDSTPYKLFVIAEDRRATKVFILNKGDYVNVRGPENDRFAAGKILTKKIVCVPGETLKVVELDYYCCSENDQCIHLGKAKTKSRKGEDVTPFNPCRKENQEADSSAEPKICMVRVPEKSYFLVNPHPDSYDSRYMGFISEEQITAKLKPVF